MDKNSRVGAGEEENRKAIDIWEQNAAFWDERFGEGNDFQRWLIGPVTDRLLKIKPGEIVLDLACGNGHYSRRMAEAGAQVVAFDASQTFIKRARQRSEGLGDKIEYHVIDATDEAQLLTLGENRFDAAVCTMALMDISDIEPLFGALKRLLKAGGRFVFSVTHPCFNSSDTLKVVEEMDREGDLVENYSVKVFRYNSLGIARGLGIIGQPEAQYYFNRTISVLFRSCFEAGFVVDGLDEPTFGAGAKASRPFSWANFQEIPPVLSARTRSASI